MNAGNPAQAAEALRNEFASYLKDSSVESIPLSARVDSLVAEEARQKECDYVLYVSMSVKKGGGGSMFGRTSTQIQELNGSDTVVTSGWSVSVNSRTGEYSVSPPTIIVNGSGTYSLVSEVKGTCHNPFNKGTSQSQPQTGAKLTAEGPTLYGKGRIDPNKPDEISGTDTLTMPTNKGGERK